MTGAQQAHPTVNALVVANAHLETQVEKLKAAVSIGELARHG